MIGGHRAATARPSHGTAPRGCMGAWTPRRRPRTNRTPTTTAAWNSTSETLMSRRSLGIFLGAGTAAALAACTPGGSPAGGASSTGAAPPAAASASGSTAAASGAASAAPTLTRAIAECGVEIRGNGRTVPRRRIQRAERPGGIRGGPEGHHRQLRHLVHQGDGVPLTVTLTLLDNAKAAHRWPAPPSTPGTATRTESTRCTTPD